MILLEIFQVSPTLWAARPGAFNPALKAQLGSIPGLRWDKSRRAYLGDRVGIETAAGTCEEAKLAMVARDTEERFELSAPWHSFDSRLLPYQAEGAQWLTEQLARRGAALLADDMGLGKTPQAIAALDACLDRFAMRVVVCPAIVVPHWRREIEKWAKLDEHVPYAWSIYSYEDFQAALKLDPGSPPKKRAGKHPLVPLPSNPAAIVFDEAHYISNARAKRSDAIKTYCHLHPNMLRVGLTGTPINSRVRNLWSILDTLYPGAFGSFWAFTRRYCDGHYNTIAGREGASIQAWDTDGSSNLEELNARLRDFMLRRTKSEVAMQLPARRRIALDVPLPARIRKQLQAAQKAMHLAAATQDLRLSASSMLSHVEEHKVPAAIELASELIEQGHKVLLLTTRIETATQLSKQLACPMAAGETSPEARAGVLQAASLAVSTIYAVTTGINLVNFDTIIFVGLDWVPSTLLQAEARIHRIGQNNACLIYYLVGEQSIDEIVRSQVINRLEIFEQAIGSEDSQLRSDLRGVSDSDILKAFAEKLSAS